ncbi:MAG: tRNA (guanosine(37)-N1)-methyltransferase TrmD [Bacillota bacterium]
MKIDLVTIFPGLLDGPFRESMIRRAVDKGLVEINLIDLRSYTRDRHRQVDDTPYGGGFGMILKPEPLFAAIEDLKNNSGEENRRVILMTPQGRRFNQDIARKLAMEKHLILICGRYEGVDERVRIAVIDEEISIGDFVLTGGELAAAVLVDAVVRLLPGFLAEEAADNESFTGSLLEHPHYTRPPVFRDMEAPSVLLSGNHGEIARWRRQQSLKRTYERRPDLLEKAELSSEDKSYIEALKKQL